MLVRYLKSVYSKQSAFVATLDSSTSEQPQAYGKNLSKTCSVQYEEPSPAKLQSESSPVNIVQTVQSTRISILIGLVQTLHPGLKWIHWQLDKLVLKVASCLDKNDDISHLAELDSCWPREFKMSPKIALQTKDSISSYSPSILFLTSRSS